MVYIKKLFREYMDGFKVFDLVVIALVAALGVAIKPIVVPLAHMITGPFLIPGGAVAGGFYMMWIVVGAGIIKRTGTGTMIGLVQAIMVIVLGIYGSHGIMSLVTYTLPGIAVDIVFIISRKEKYSMVGSFIAGMCANITGTYITSIVFFRLPLIPLLLGITAAALSGGLGGIIAFKINEQLKRYGFVNKA